MRQLLPILVLLAGLGTSSSLIQTGVAQADMSKPAMATEEVNPFSRYLSLEKVHRHESGLIRFAGACGIDLASSKPRYAQRPGDTWKIVPDLSKAKDDQETDFYGTVSVLHQSGLILVELWGMELDTGDYFRIFYCLNKEQITFAESVSWRMAGLGDNTSDTTWGYEHRWKLGRNGELETTLTRYIDPAEKPIPSPKLDAETLKSLKEEAVGAKTWADLELPSALLR